jgi:hypothetical protein
VQKAGLNPKTTVIAYGRETSVSSGWNTDVITLGTEVKTTSQAQFVTARASANLSNNSLLKTALVTAATPVAVHATLQACKIGTKKLAKDARTLPAHSYKRRALSGFAKIVNFCADSWICKTFISLGLIYAYQRHSAKQADLAAVQLTGNPAAAADYYQQQLAATPPHWTNDSLGNPFKPEMPLLTDRIAYLNAMQTPK